jgi:SecY interacting protein Syd
LLQVWNEQDFERLLQNLIGHALMKRRLEQPMTLFFAVTDDEDYILSLENDTGRVMLERVGLEPQEMLADNLAQFLSSLEPADPAC